MGKDMRWEDRWEVDQNNQDDRAGGQGTIKRVRHKNDGTIGALKKLHPNYEDWTERRYRLSQEVGALRVLKGNGTPIIYESNETSWENKDIQLYVIMEWIEGATLAELINGKGLTIDEALEIINPLLDTIEACHQLGIYHRDLKPDNIILRNGKISDPILVDFGLASQPFKERENDDFKTDPGQRFGNQFFRLPEQTPYRHAYDARSDLTVLAGLLFYIITGKAPRIPRDGQDKMPHEVELISKALSQDRKWPRLSRLFNIAFQQSSDQRFQSPEQLRRYIMALEPSIEDDTPLEKARQELEEVVKIARMKERNQIVTVVQTTSHTLTSKLAELAGEDFVCTGMFQVEDNGFCYHSNFGINMGNIPDPRVNYVHTLRYESGEYVASYEIKGTKIRREYYRGVSADIPSLQEAVGLAAKEILAHLLSLYRTELTKSSKL